jgi:ATP-dependent DNA ligase
MLKRLTFIPPSIPVLKPAPPTGKEWLHEVKFDGWRAQLLQRYLRLRSKMMSKEAS